MFTWFHTSLILLLSHWLILPLWLFFVYLNSNYYSSWGLGYQICFYIHSVVSCTIVCKYLFSFTLLLLTSQWMIVIFHPIGQVTKFCQYCVSRSAICHIWAGAKNNDMLWLSFSCFSPLVWEKSCSWLELSLHPSLQY